MKNLSVIILILLFLCYNAVSYAQWVQTSNPFGAGVVRLVVSEPDIFAGTNNAGAFLTTDNGTNWLPVGLDSSVIYTVAVSGTNIFAGTNKGVSLTTDNGLIWTLENSGLPGNLFVYDLAVSGINIYAGTDQGVCLSVNNGSNWNQINNGLIASNISALAASGTNIVSGSANKIYLSTNSGSNWTQLNNSISSPFVDALIISGTNVYAGTDGSGVYLSTDNGTTWAQANNGLPDNSHVHSFTLNGTNVFVGTDNGVYLTTDNGTSWKQAGLATGVYSLVIRQTNIYAGTSGAGVWKRPLSEFTGVSDEINNRPQDYSLSQNYPNPFNPGTIITYSLPSASNVRLIVYNTLGQSVNTLESGYKNAGKYSVNFNASDLPSGIYFYKLEAGQFSQIKKMILIK